MMKAFAAPKKTPFVRRILKDSLTIWRSNEISGHRRRLLMFTYNLLFFLTSTDLMKDNKSNS